MLAWCCACFLLAACDDDDKQRVTDTGEDGGNEGGVTDAGANDSDAAVDAGPEPVSCGDVTANGRCASAMRVEVCVTPTGAAGPPRLEGYNCRVGETCDDSSGIARCALTSECVAGDTDCADGKTLRTCVAGTWMSSACASDRCIDSVLGAVCAPSVPTQTLTGTVNYEARLPDFDQEKPANEQAPNWASNLSVLPARGFAVLSYAGDQLLDATYTDDTGAFSVLGPETAAPGDALVVLCAGEDAAGRLAFAVGDAGYAPSNLLPREPFETPPKAQLWSYSFALAAFSNQSTITIPDAQGSAAAHIFDTLRGVFKDMEAHYTNRKAPSVIVWVAPGTIWSCGACMSPNPRDVAEQRFLHQVWLDGSSENQGYWSDAVTAHELGHYVMAAYGYPPAEGGAHSLGTPTNPGQAWSEGFATYFSSLQRSASKYYDKQQGVFFWFDLALRDYVGVDEDDYTWQRPTAAAGIEQLMDENEVASLLYATQAAIGSKAPMLTALGSLRMRVPPFERGYTLRTWPSLDPAMYTETNESIPYLADYLDALRCADAISATALDAITVPATQYPYPSASPLCR